jgi:ATP-binding cassette subfamily F protein 3
VLSGGEKSRVALAKSLTTDSNFLILDEPTNHLDIQSVNILIQSLTQYEGTFIAVSHDRYFLDNVANKIWFIEGHDIQVYPGTYQEYEEWQSKRDKTGDEGGIKPAKAEKPKKEEPKPSEVEEKKKQLKKLNAQLQTLEDEIAEKEKTVKDLEAEIAKEEIYSNPTKLSEVNERYAKAKESLGAVQLHWEKLAEEIMVLEG